jgi:glutamate/tyrosine decarboxylase-like PLP-dependent enzyme
MSEHRETLDAAAGLAMRYLDGLVDRPVWAMDDGPALRERFDRPVPEAPTDPAVVVADLAAAADAGLVASPGPRYFGFVTGGAVPAALGADWLVSAWDQNAANYVASPAASVLESVAARWIKELLGLPETASVGFVTGCQMAHVTALAAARHAVLERVGWSVPQRGLSGAPPIRVLTSRKRHATVDRAVRLLGLGDDSLRLLPVDDAGRVAIDGFVDELNRHGGPTIVVAQAGEVNTGSFDPFVAMADALAGTDAWLHVDGAFGIWARVAPDRAALADGVERADSWAFDAHKWLNVPYDSGIVVVGERAHHGAAMAYGAEYLPTVKDERDGNDWVPEASRRARAIPVYAAIRSLGRRGVSDVVQGCCDLARRFAAGVESAAGATMLNDVVLNQVLFRFGDDDETANLLERVQRSGETWMGGTTWDGRAAIRCSVSGWMTTADDIDRAVATFVAARREVVKNDQDLEPNVSRRLK